MPLALPVPPPISAVPHPPLLALFHSPSLASPSPSLAGTGRAVQWVTPLGLPVVQPYRKTSSVSVRTVVQVPHKATQGGER